MPVVLPTPRADRAPAPSHLTRWLAPVAVALVGVLAATRYAGPLVGLRSAAAERVPSIALGAGLLLTAALTALVHLLTGGRQRAEQHAAAAWEHSARLGAVVEATPDLVILYSVNGDLLWANNAARRFAGLDHESEIRGLRAADLVAGPSRAAYVEEVATALRRGDSWSGELLMHRADGRHVPVSQHVRAHRGPGGDVLYYSAIARDISERIKFELELAHQALHDGLTGLPNRVLLLDRVERALGRVERRGATVAVLFLDVDRFKYVNDSLGHEAGDRLLLEVSRRLVAGLRSDDTAARCGGDEFALVCEDIADEAHVVAIAERVCRELGAPFDLDGTGLHPSASIGIALAGPATGTLAEDLLRDAEVAMYRAKERGKARFELFDEDLRDRSARRLTLENALHEALEAGELRVHYQPEICLREGRVIAVEALLRWQRTDGELSQPDEFIPLAEETGLVVPIGEWVLREAAWQAARWQRARGDGRPFTVWVNVAPLQLADPGFVDLVAAILRETNVDQGALGLEITERGLLHDAEAAISVLTQLRALGVRLAVDDFGTGYSSLSYLKRLPIDAVKVDRSFVHGLGSDPDDSAICAAS